MGIAKDIRSDFKAVFERDPAARTSLSVVGIPGKTIPKEEFPVYQGLEHNKLPDPEELVLQSQIEDVNKLENRIKLLETKLKKTNEEKRALKIVKTK